MYVGILLLAGNVEIMRGVQDIQMAILQACKVMFVDMEWVG